MNESGLELGDVLLTDGHQAVITDLNSSWTDYSGESNHGIRCEWVSGPDAGKAFVFKSVAATVKAKRAAMTGWSEKMGDGTHCSARSRRLWRERCHSPH